MKIIIAGASGLIGAELVPYLRKEGHQVLKLVRKETGLSADEIYWDPKKGKLDCKLIEGSDAFINLSGENIAEGRWTAEKKRLIKESRLQSVHTLCSCLLKLKQTPKVLINASAIGYYGSQNDLWVTEDSPSGSGFLADVCKEWENAAKEAERNGVRVVFLRTGIVLSAKGGALAKMLTPFKLGFGGQIGSGKQYMSWISIQDILKIIGYLIKEDKIQGPVNAVSPNPVTNQDFTRILGAVLNRPTVFTMPEFVARLAFGEMADEMLLSSTRVAPKRLIDSGYSFVHNQLEETLKNLLK